MVEGGGDLGLLAEARGQGWIQRDARMHDFERDPTPKAFLYGEPDAPHASRPEWALQAVTGEHIAGFERLLHGREHSRAAQDALKPSL